MLMGSLTPVITPSAYAEPQTETVVRTANEEPPINQIEHPDTEEQPADGETPAEGETPVEGETPAEGSERTIEIVEGQGPSCSSQLSPVGWIVCPIMDVTAKAVDSLYDVIENLLRIEPLSSNNESPVYKVWSYCLGLTNLVFIIFFLIVIYSQITGFGITNYGIKRALPKLIVAVLLVNLSFHICALAVDASNIIGSSLRGFFESVPTQIGNVTISSNLSFTDVASAVLAGAGIAVGGVIAFDLAALFMLIPAILGGLVAIISGLVTIAIRQAVVILLVMIAPLALVCYMLPNTEHLFKKWKDLFTKMLVFYPMFSLLFGASHLAGWVIILSALERGSMLMIILGLAVQIFPLIACWSLMKMSGTFLSSINSGLRNLADKPLAANRAWAESRKQNSYAKHLANKSSLPSRRLMQYLADRKTARELETKANMETVSLRGGAYHANSHYKKSGGLSRKGVRAYKGQTLNLQYKSQILKHDNTFEEGIGVLAREGSAKRRYYDKLDGNIVDASDVLAMETARSELIEYDNAASRQKRFENAIAAHINAENAGKAGYLPAVIKGETPEQAEARYEQMKNIMQYRKSIPYSTQYISAAATSTFAAQKNIMTGKFEKYNELVPPTQYVEHRVLELAREADSSQNIDAIIGGLRIFNNRGDTSIIEKAINELCKDGKLELGTHASQSLASFLMFEVKDRDSTLRRFGKYINLETAHYYNDLKTGQTDEDRRHKKSVDLEEYVTGEYIDRYEVDENGQNVPVFGHPKRDMRKLLLGTSFSGAEREAYMVLQDTIKQANTPDWHNGEDHENQKVNVGDFIKKSQEVFDAILPNIVNDQFSYLSGSEQITALAKFITEFPLKNGQLSDDPDEKRRQEESLTAYLNKRVDDFVHAQVYSQIAKSKSDMFSVIKDHYDNRAAKDLDLYETVAREEREQKIAENQWDWNIDDDTWRQMTVENEEWKKSVRSGKNKYAESHKEELREASSKLFTKNLQKGVENSLFLNARRGNLPDSKTGLTEYLDLNNIAKQTEVWNKTHPKNGNNNSQQRNSRAEEEEEEDAPTEDDYGPTSTEPGLEELLHDLQLIYGGYVGALDSRETRENFFADASQVIRSSDVLSEEEKHNILSGILPSNQSVSEMFNDINNRLNG